MGIIVKSLEKWYGVYGDYMDIVYKVDGNNQFIKNDGIVYFFGSNQSGKSYLLSLLREGFKGKNKDFTVNNLLIEKNNYNVIYLDDITDFNEEFKFTKNNIFRELIYNSVLNNVNEKKLLKDVNELFDKIDTKVNQFLDININKKQEEKVYFDIEITDVNDIIDKFTNIYIDNYLLKESNIPRSTKRKLIYNLLLFELNKAKSVENIVIIDNFDLYLDFENTKKIINKLNEYRIKNPNTYFFLSSSNNLYELINNKSSIYHINNKHVFHIDKIEKVVEHAILKKSYYEYCELGNTITFEEYEFNNAQLLKNDVDKKIKEIFNICQNEIGKIYISNTIKLISNLNKKYNDVVIYCKDRFYQYFYEEIYNRLNNIC